MQNKTKWRQLLFHCRNLIFPQRDEPAHLHTGKWGEALAEKELRGRGMKCIGRRVRVGPRDEIDLIMRERETLVFVEVKTRATELRGRPVSAVNRNKRTRLGRAAFRYMKHLREKPPYFRFDIVEVIGHPDQDRPEIRHLQNVFQLPARYRVPW